MHQLVIFIVGTTFGTLIGGVFNALSYDKGCKDGYDAGYDDSSKLWRQMMDSYLEHKKRETEEHDD